MDPKISSQRFPTSLPYFVYRDFDDLDTNKTATQVRLPPRAIITDASERVRPPYL
jgi:hypothetical protein